MFRRITSIFCLTIDHPFPLVDYPDRTTAIRCRIGADDMETQYEHVRHGDTSRKQTCLIDITDFTEKCAYLQTRTNDYFCLSLSHPYAQLLDSHISPDKRHIWEVPRRTHLSETHQDWSELAYGGWDTANRKESIIIDATFNRQWRFSVKESIEID